MSSHLENSGSEYEDTLGLPDGEKCQKLVEEFVSLTNTNEALAQFFLQDHNWILSDSINAFYESEHQSEGNESVILLCEESPSDKRVSTSGNQSINLRRHATIRPPSRFSLISWNLDGLDPQNLKKRTKAVIKIIQMEMPDIIFLQEVIPVTYTYLEDHLPDYVFITGGVSDYFNVTLLRRTTVYFDNFDLHPFLSSRMGRNLIYTECHIGSLKLRLLNSHLESTKECGDERKVQLQYAVNLMSQGPCDSTTIFGGDLNLRDSEVVGVIPNHFHDLWVHCGKRKECEFTWDTLRNTNKSFPGKFKPRMRFDRVYLKDGSPKNVLPFHFGLVGIQRIAGTQSFPSDHWGIHIRFNILQEESSSLRSSHPQIVEATNQNGSLEDNSSCSTKKNDDALLGKGQSVKRLKTDDISVIEIE